MRQTGATSVAMGQALSTGTARKGDVAVCEPKQSWT